MAKAKATRAKDSKASKAARAAKDKMSFEEALEALEGVVDQLEDGALPLEEALVEFEKGVALSRRCSEELDAADRRIEVLIEQSGGVDVRPFDLEAPESEDEENSSEGGAF